MKSSIFWGLVFLAQSSFASALVGLPPDLQSVQFIAGELESVKPLCPAGAKCVVDGTQLSLRFTLGCLDQFGDYDYRIAQSGEIIFSMIGLISAESAALRCVRPSARVIKVPLPNVFPPFEIQFIGRPGSLVVPGFSPQSQDL